MKNDKDYSVDGPGSPVSLKKFLDDFPSEEEVRGVTLGDELGIATQTEQPLKPLTLLVDGTGTGIAKDAPGVIYITPEECSTQSIYYTTKIFDGRRIPAYLYRHMSYLWELDQQFENDEEVIKFMTATPNVENDKNYLMIRNLLKYCESSTESQQLIGLIQLITGSMSAMKKAGKSAKIYIDRPETALHPKRQARFMSWFIKTCKEYGVNLGK